MAERWGVWLSWPPWKGRRERAAYAFSIVQSAAQFCDMALSPQPLRYLSRSHLPKMILLKSEMAEKLPERPKATWSRKSKLSSIICPLLVDTPSVTTEEMEGIESQIITSQYK